MNKIIVVTSDEPSFRIKTSAPLREIEEAKDFCDKVASGVYDYLGIPAKVVKTVSIDFINAIWFYGYHEKHISVHFFTLNYINKSLKIRKHNYESVCKYFDKCMLHYEEFNKFNNIVDEPTNFSDDIFTEHYRDVFGDGSYYDVLNSFKKKT